MMKKYMYIFAFAIAASMYSCADERIVEDSEEIPTESFTVNETLETTVSVDDIAESTTTTETTAATETSTVATEFPTASTKEVPDAALVRILDYIPDAVIDLRYATTNNFTGTVIYDSDEAYLCYGAVKKLALVQEELKSQGFRIIIWDAYRPIEAQWKLWEVYPDPTYVANPSNGITGHGRGGTVDIGIVNLDGSKVELPSEFDEFSLIADRDYSDVSEKAAENSMILEAAMNKYGFSGYWGEWWDYTDGITYSIIYPDETENE